MENDVADQAVALHRVTDGALTWIDTHLNRFDPIGAGVEPDTAKLKPLVELAVLCTSLLPHGTFREDRRVHRFLQLVRHTYDNAIFRERVFRSGSEFIPYTLLATALQRGGLARNDDHRQLQYVVDHGNVATTERLPHRTLDLRHVLDGAGLRHRLPSYARLYRDTMLAKGINPISASSFDAYSVTHTLFYLTDWGAEPATAIPASHRPRARWLVEQMLGMTIRRGDWDLAGEFLLSCHCLGITDSPLYAVGWQALDGAQWPDGAMPGPGYNPAKAAEQDEPSLATYLFDECCHTTLVAAFAGGIGAFPVTR